MKKAFLLLILCLFCFLTYPFHSSTSRHTIDVNGVKRYYELYLPPKPAGPLPLVVVLHGGGGTAKGTLRTTGWVKKAKEENFIVLAPEGTKPYPAKPASFIGNPQTWNDGGKLSVGAVKRQAQDVEFLRKLLDYLKKGYSVNPKRIYVTGFSNGGSMTLRLAREMADTFAAAAAVTGTDWLTQRPPSRPIPLMYITGTHDPLNPIHGGEVRIGRKILGRKPPLKQMIESWKNIHNLTQPPKITRRAGIVKCTYSPKFIVYLLPKHGHYWPDNRATQKLRFLFGKNTAPMKATDVIWQWFLTHSL